MLMKFSDDATTVVGGEGVEGTVAAIIQNSAEYAPKPTLLRART